MDKSSLKQKDL